jgi:hypothetical protein
METTEPASGRAAHSESAATAAVADTDSKSVELSTLSDNSSTDNRVRTTSIVIEEAPLINEQDRGSESDIDTAQTEADNGNDNERAHTFSGVIVTQRGAYSVDDVESDAYDEEFLDMVDVMHSGADHKSTGYEIPDRTVSGPVTMQSSNDTSSLQVPVVPVHTRKRSMTDSHAQQHRWQQQSKRKSQQKHRLRTQHGRTRNFNSNTRSVGFRDGGGVSRSATLRRSMFDRVQSFGASSRSTSRQSTTSDKELKKIEKLVQKFGAEYLLKEGTPEQRDVVIVNELDATSILIPKHSDGFFYVEEMLGDYTVDWWQIQLVSAVCLLASVSMAITQIVLDGFDEAKADIGVMPIVMPIICWLQAHMNNPARESRVPLADKVRKWNRGPIYEDDALKYQQLKLKGFKFSYIQLVFVCIIQIGITIWLIVEDKSYEAVSLLFGVVSCTIFWILLRNRSHLKAMLWWNIALSTTRASVMCRRNLAKARGSASKVDKISMIVLYVLLGTNLLRLVSGNTNKWLVASTGWLGITIIVSALSIGNLSKVRQLIWQHALYPDLLVPIMAESTGGILEQLVVMIGVQGIAVLGYLAR